MKYRVAVLAMGLLVCLPLVAFSYPTISENEQIEKLQSMPDRDINIAESALIFSKTVYPNVDVSDYLDKVDVIAADAARHSKIATAEKAITAISSYYRERKIKAESILTAILSPSETERDKFMLSRVIDTKSGNCLGLTTLFWSIAERLPVRLDNPDGILPLRAVIIPQHVFLRYYDENGKYRNIEATSFGAQLEDSEYVDNTNKKTKEDKSSKYNSPAKVNFYVLNKKQFLGLILYNRGVDNLNRQNLDAAMNDFNSCLKLYPNFHEALKSRASIELRRDNYTPAVPLQRDYSSAKAELLNYKDALADLKKANSVEPDCPTTLFNLGNAYLNLNYLTEALNNYDRALELAPDYTEVHHNRGLCFAQEHRYERAIEELSLVIKATPSAKAYYDRAIINGNLKNYTEALSDYSDAISLDEKLTDAYNNRSIIYASQGLFLNAVSDLERALSMLPNNEGNKKAFCYKNLGLTFYKMKSFAKAIENFEKYLTLDPEDIEIINILKSLK